MYPTDQGFCTIHSITKSYLLEALWNISVLENLVVQIFPEAGQKESTDA